MGIALWRSSLFFASIFLFAVLLFPSHRELGKLFMESRNFGRARMYLEKRYQQDENDILNAKRYMESLLYRGELSNFEVVGKSVSELYSDNPSINKMMANYYEYDMRYNEAEPYWLRILKLENDNIAVKNKLVSHYIYEKEYDKLIKFYRQEIDKGSASADTYRQIGRYYELALERPNAVDAYERLIRLYPDSYADYIKLAKLYDYSKEPGKAFLLYKKAADADSQNKTYSLLFIEKLMHRSMNKEALLRIIKLRKIYARDIDLMRIQTDLYIRLKDGKNALMMLEKIYSQQKHDNSLLKSMGEISAQLGKNDKAIAYLRKYHEKTGGDYHSHHLLGDIFAAAGNAVASKKEYEKALSIIRAKSRP